MTDSIANIRQYLLQQELFVYSMNSSFSNSSLDSRYDTDSSPQRQLSESYIPNFHTKFRKVCCNEKFMKKIELNIGLETNELLNDNQFFNCTDCKQQNSCTNKDKSNDTAPKTIAPRSISFQNINEEVNQTRSSFPKRKACSSIKLNHFEYQFFCNKTVTLNQFSTCLQETEERKARRMNAGMKVLDKISKEVSSR